MKLTQNQISEFITELTATSQGIQELFTVILNALMKHERTLWQQEQHESSNGFRPRRIRYKGLEFALKVPRTRDGGFYPFLLAILRDESEERDKLITDLYSNGLTTQQIGKIIGNIYSQTYSKQHISYLVRKTTQDLELWLARQLAARYSVLYIDATYVPTRRDGSVSREAYYSMLGVLPNGTREVLSIVNHPTEGAINWRSELNALKERGVEQVDLIVSDALSGIENAVSSAFPTARHQFCVAHLLREMSAHVSRKDAALLRAEFKEVLSIESSSVSSASQYAEFQQFIERWSNKFPSFRRYKNPRNMLYFTFLDYPCAFRRMLYTTNWIERLNRSYKRTLRMRGAMPNSDSVLFLLGSVAMQMTETTYARPIAIFKDWITLCSSDALRYGASRKSPSLGA